MALTTSLTLIAVLLIVLRTASALPTLVVLSFDGFRWDYIKNTSLPNFRSLASSGVTAVHGMQSSFPTVTFPNHVTLVSGLYPESHGIVANNMYDPVFGEPYSAYNESRDYTEWYTGFEPIWISNELATADGKGVRKSAVYQWPASNVLFHGQHPHYYERKHLPLKTADHRFSQILDVMQKDPAPNLIMSYFEEPDEVGHHDGTSSAAIWELLKYYDQLLGDFLSKLKAMSKEVNLVIVSDHGMVDCLPNGMININELLDSSWHRTPELGPIASIWPKGDYTSTIFERLSKVKQLKVFHKKDIPSRLHYQKSRRISPLLAILDKGYLLVRSTNRTVKGCHGYDNALQDMNAVFIASGPSFQKGIVLPSFSNVHIYALLCHLLQIKGKPNNGTLEIFKDAIIDFETKRVHLSKRTLGLVLCVGISIVLVIIIGACFLAHRRKREQAYNYTRVESTKLSVLDPFHNESEDMP